MPRTFDLLISAFQNYIYSWRISQQGNCGVNLEVSVCTLPLSILNCKLFARCYHIFYLWGNYFLFLILFRRIYYFAEGFDVVLIDKSLLFCYSMLYRREEGKWNTAGYTICIFWRLVDRKG